MTNAALLRGPAAFGPLCRPGTRRAEKSRQFGVRFRCFTPLYGLSACYPCSRLTATRTPRLPPDWTTDGPWSPICDPRRSLKGGRFFFWSALGENFANVKHVHLVHIPWIVPPEYIRVIKEMRCMTIYICMQNATLYIWRLEIWRICTLKHRNARGLICIYHMNISEFRSSFPPPPQSIF